MFYVRKEISEGVKIEFELYEDEIFTRCPECNKEMSLDNKKLDSMLRKVKPSQKGTRLMSTPGGEQEISIISEKGIYAVSATFLLPEFFGTIIAALFSSFVNTP